MRFTPALLAAFLVLPLASCQDASTPTAVNPKAAFDMAAVQTEPMDVTVFDPCDGEDVHMVGSIQYVANVSFDGAGGFHYVLNRNWTVKGTGLTSGDTYLANFPQNTSLYFQDPFPQIYTQVWDNFVTRTGTSGGYVLLTSQKFVANGNGDVVQNSPTYKAFCKS